MRERKRGREGGGNVGIVSTSFCTLSHPLLVLSSYALYFKMKYEKRKKGDLNNKGRERLFLQTPALLLILSLHALFVIFM